MRLLKLSLYPWIILIISLSMIQCGWFYDTELENTQNVFPNTNRWNFKIDPASPSTSDPVFSWNVTGHPHLTLMILNQHVEVDYLNRTIINQKEVIWMWNTMLPTGRDGNVTYSDGIPIIQGKPDAEHYLPSLPAGTYYIAGWIQDKAMNLQLSSVEYVFTKVDS